MQSTRTVRAPSIAVPIQLGEPARKAMQEAGFLKSTLRPFVSDGFLFIPLSDVVTQDEVTAQLVSLAALELTYAEKESIKYIESKILIREFAEQKERPRSYKEIVGSDSLFPSHLVDLLPSSFDVVGSVIILRLPDELYAYRSIIGAALLVVHRNVRSVALDRGVAGTFRVRTLEIIGGEPSLKTVYTEHGVSLEMDLSTTYFSPRLATERMHVARSIQKPEFIVDAFAGVGPFSLVIAKHSRARPKRIIANDLNPDAVACLRSNIETNRCGDFVEARNMDAKALLREFDQADENNRPDRIIMNLPHSASDFLSDAIRAVASSGTINYHAICEDEEIAEQMTMIRAAGSAAQRTVSITGQRVVSNYSASMSHYAIDLLVR